MKESSEAYFENSGGIYVQPSNIFWPKGDISFEISIH